MTKFLLPVILCTSLFSVNAQDSTYTKARIGVRISSDISLLNNKSLGILQQQFQQTGVDASGIGNRFVTTALSLVRDRQKVLTESRILYVNSNTVDPTTTNTDKSVVFYGFGFGGTQTFKLADTKRFMVGPTVGVDFMWYRLRILPKDPQNLNLSNIIANPTYYSTVRLRQGFYTNLTGAISADYKTGWLKSFYDDFRVGARVGYQLPLVRSKTWRYGDGTVNELASFRSNMLFVQIGVTLVSKVTNRN
ncbi:hypothetical protein [Spirosoma sp. KUDC1026]|uniref:hypothetical protein n=1 Tax=Spirosoma sp. KUDC1026 TaxID=2745947 RepID=UPI00159B89B3|nr:hypothetical protein [Spirosoma sp. KUDC1026]QKZ15554.1 hypothetical protein HU175_24220 [Spirosoma sp. KUDC1026]